VAPLNIVLVRDISRTSCFSEWALPCRVQPEYPICYGRRVYVATSSVHEPRSYTLLRTSSNPAGVASLLARGSSDMRLLQSFRSTGEGRG